MKDMAILKTIKVIMSDSETKAPKGYQLSDKIVKIEINFANIHKICYNKNIL